MNSLNQNLAGWTHVFSGKVRDVYAPTDVAHHSGTETVLMVASDRISAFDYVLPTPIPDKGKVLTNLTLWWFEQLSDVVENHLVSLDVPAGVEGRAMVTERLKMFPIECVVRGYLTGSGMAEYKEKGTVCGIELPEGLREAEQLPEPIFTPAAKAAVGEHDENISFDEVVERIGAKNAARLRDLSIALYTKARDIAAERGVILADTKFEFGAPLDPGSEEIILADEILTPDSSRFWDAEIYEVGKVQPSLDKQFIRNWLKSDESGWDGVSEPPELPDHIVDKTRERYIHAYEKLTGRTWK